MAAVATTRHEAPQLEMNRSIAITALLLSSLATDGCRRCHELLFVRAEATNAFAVTDATRSSATPVALYAQSDQAGEDRSYAVIASNSGGSDNLMITLYGFETPPGDRIAVTVAIPVSAAAGDVYKITRAF